MSDGPWTRRTAKVLPIRGAHRRAWLDRAMARRRAGRGLRRPPAWAIAATGVAIGVAGALLAGAGAFDALTTPPDPNRIAGYVTRVIDGDSIVVGLTEIRLGDFDAPEWDQRGGAAAKSAIREIASWAWVECRRCEGARTPGQCTSYDRVIATCRLDGQRLGDLMRARGLREGGR